MSWKATGAAVVSAALLFGALAAPALGRDERERTVRLQDRCDPSSFGALCAPNFRGNVTPEQLVAELRNDPQDVLADRDALGWRFQPDELGVERGTTLVARNTGGETHTFTNVTATGFTGGCIDALNAPLGLSRNPQHCPNGLADLGAVIASSGVPSGGTREFQLSGAGPFKFECLIHPWMRADVTVEDR